MPETPVKVDKKPVLINFLTVIAAIEFIRMALFLTLLPSFLMSINYTTAALGVVISVNLLADNLSKSAMGWLVDHYGPWPVLVAGSCLVFGGVWMIINFHQYLWLLIIAAVIIGIGAAPTWPAVISGSIRLAGEARRASMISLISVVWMAGGGLGPVLMGFLIDESFQKLLLKYQMPGINAYQTGFLILLVVAFGAVLISILGWVNWRRKIEVQDQPLLQLHPLRKLRIVLEKLWQIKGLIPGMFFQTLSLGMLIPNLLPYTTGQLGLSESQYSLLLLVGGTFVILFMVPVGHLADRMGSRGFLVAGFGLAAISLVCLMKFGTALTIWWLVPFTGLSYALIQPAWNSLLAGSIPPDQRGVLMGLFMSVEGAGFAVGPAVGGFLGSLSISGQGILAGIGPGLPFYISSICLAIMAFVYLVYPFKHYEAEDV